ncbi:hypothetical protein, partial [Petrocella sp. FN5]|uniref:hypothetical protein n=1 Tax=Petrocella sp. FN5 TaxID=3032002 RepID=UPI0023DC8485
VLGKKNFLNFKINHESQKNKIMKLNKIGKEGSKKPSIGRFFHGLNRPKDFPIFFMFPKLNKSNLSH